MRRPRPVTSRFSISRSLSGEQEAAIVDLYANQRRSHLRIAIPTERSAQARKENTRPKRAAEQASGIEQASEVEQSSVLQGVGSDSADDVPAKNSLAFARWVPVPSVLVAPASEASFSPGTSSPLNPKSVNVDGGSSDQKEIGLAAANAWLRVPTVHHHRSSPVLRVPIPELRLPEAVETASLDTRPRLQAPRSVRDLGADYTRYFDPPPIPRRKSSSALGRRRCSPHLLPNSNGNTVSDASKRLSDPFKDSKRLSNPFESAEVIELSASPPDDSSMFDTTTRMPALPPALPRRTAPSVMTCEHDVNTEKAPFFQLLDDRLAAPDYSFPLMTDQKEDDDDLHMPYWDDDIRLKPRWKDHFTRESIVSTFGLILMVTGLLFIFVILPIISYLGTGIMDYYYDTPLGEMPGYGPGEPWAHVNDRKYPLLQNIRQGLIDPDTPDDAKVRSGVDGVQYNLVFSDEFNIKNRTFYPGDDPFWFGFDGWYAATNDLEWYSPDAINTGRCRLSSTNL